MVLMWGLELTLFAVVMFAWTPASTWAGVNDVAAAGPAWTAAGVVAASAFLMASGMTSARAAAAPTAKRVRVDDMAGRLHQSSGRLINRSKHPEPLHATHPYESILPIGSTLTVLTAPARDRSTPPRRPLPDPDRDMALV